MKRDSTKPTAFSDTVDVQTCSEKAMHTSVKSTMEHRIPKINNPHPRISWKTWAVLSVLVVIGIYIYVPYFRSIDINRTEFTNINLVYIPKIIGEKEISRGGIDIVRKNVVGRQELLEEGSIEGIAYGDPFYIKNGIGQGWLLYAKKLNENDDKQACLAQIISGWSNDRLLTDSKNIDSTELFLGCVSIAPNKQGALFNSADQLSFVYAIHESLFYVLLGISDKENVEDMKHLIENAAADLTNQLRAKTGD